MIGLHAAAAGAKNAGSDPTPPVVTPSPTISFSAGSNVNVSGASGMTSDQYHCNATGGAGGPYGFVLQKVGFSGSAVDFADPTSGESKVTWEGLNIGDVATLSARALCTDAGGNTALTGVLTITITRVS